MRGQGALIAVTLAAVLIGALFLKGVAKEPPSDPTASTDNGAPAGWLALRLLLERRGVPLVVRRGLDEAWTDEPALLVVPPAEAAGWREDEVSAVLERVRAGALALLLVCDEDGARNHRAGHWWQALGVSCSPLGARADMTARGTMPAYPHQLLVPGKGRVGTVADGLGVPAWVDEEASVVVLRLREGRGAVTVLASATALANDGLARGDNAAFFLSLVPAGGAVVVDESHHKPRGAEVLEQAFDRTGPKVAFAALLLLVPFVLLGFAPRRGDPPPAEAEPEPFAARAQVRALAALYQKAGVAPRPPSDLTARARDREGPPHG